MKILLFCLAFIANSLSAQEIDSVDVHGNMFQIHMSKNLTNVDSSKKIIECSLDHDFICFDPDTLEYLLAKVDQGMTQKNRSILLSSFDLSYYQMNDLTAYTTMKAYDVYAKFNGPYDNVATVTKHLKLFISVLDSLSLHGKISQEELEMVENIIETLSKFH